MRNLVRVFVLLLGFALLAGPVCAELEKKVIKRQPLGKKALDIAQSVGDGRLFVLLEGGEVQIVAANGQVQERFKVGPGVTGLEVTPDGNRIYLLTDQGKELQFVDLAYVQELSVDNSATKGAANAAVTITVFDDFQCPYCARLVPTLDQVVAAYPKDVRLVFKHFPLSMHKFAQKAAIASIAARNQGKFWPLHDQLFANYNKLNDALIRQLAEGVGLDMARYDRDVANPALLQEVNSDFQQGVDAGVRGTPAAFINGRPLKDRSLSGFNAAIAAELKRVGK